MAVVSTGFFGKFNRTFSEFWRVFSSALAIFGRHGGRGRRSFWGNSCTLFGQGFSTSIWRLSTGKLPTSTAEIKPLGWKLKWCYLKHQADSRTKVGEAFRIWIIYFLPLASKTTNYQMHFFMNFSVCANYSQSFVAILLFKPKIWVCKHRQCDAESQTKKKSGMLKVKFQFPVTIFKAEIG